MKPNLRLWPNSELLMPWAEHIGRGAGSTSDGAFQRDGVRQVMQMIVKWEDLEAARWGTLGYSSRAAAGTKIDRLPPMKHPKFPWLYCTAISGVKNIKFLGIDDGPHGPISIYKWALLTLVFTSPPYKVRKNDQINDEFERWVVKDSVISGETLNSEIGAFKYVAPNTGFNKKDFKQGLSQLVDKIAMIWTWVDVPVNFCCDANGIPTNIAACVNRVNHQTFAGCPAGTLLMLAPRITTHGAPCDPDVMGLDHSPLVCDVQMNMVYFEKGHNFCPAPAGQPETDWYLVTHNGEANGRKLLETADFNTAWQPV